MLHTTLTESGSPIVRVQFISALHIPKTNGWKCKLLTQDPGSHWIKQAKILVIFIYLIASEIQIHYQWEKKSKC